ncbi:MAG: FAD binding domain-containing protein [Myxococcota bacterium]|nr:FAD binding domain-containing protein [Myxococcota bacterium]
MIIDSFSYERPKSMQAALDLLDRHKARARVLAGGTDVVVNMTYRSYLQGFSNAGMAKARFPSVRRVAPIDTPEMLISLADVDGLGDISIGARAVRIGPCATMAALAGGDDFPLALAAIRDAAAIMGSPPIRNRATIGGNLVNARPAADTAVAAIAIGATLRLQAKAGERTLPADQFITAPGKTVRMPEELLVAIECPVGANQGSAYLRQGLRGQLEIPITCVAAWVALDANAETVTDARICLGAVGPTPLLAPNAAAVLVDASPSVERIARAADVAVTEAKPIDDFRASAGYRRDLVAVLTRRALTRAVQRAQHRDMERQ